MQQVIRINAIRARAAVLGWSLVQACAAAGVCHSTAYRWLSGSSDPRLGKYERVCAALEKALADREAELRKALGAAA